MRVRAIVTPHARREKYAVQPDGSFEISVKEPAARGAANARVRALIAAHFGVRVGAVRIARGMRGKYKTFTVLR